MSSIPVREALRSLAAEGLVLSLPHRGYRVSEATLADLEDTYRVRLQLEPMAVRIATPTLTEIHFERMEAAIQQLLDGLRMDNWLATHRANCDFHFTIYEAAGSPWLLRLVSLLWDNSARYRSLAAPHRGSPEQRAREHSAILNACRTRDAETAVQLMHEHLNRTYTMARQALMHEGAVA